MKAVRIINGSRAQPGASSGPPRHGDHARPAQRGGHPLRHLLAAMSPV